MMRSKFGQLAIFGIVLVFTAAGCGGGADTPQPVSGSVSVKGGAPVPRGTIRFTRTDKKVSAVGDINAKGEFKLSSKAKDDGAPAGEYTVTFGGTNEGGTYDRPMEKVVEIISSKYNSDATTDVKLTVKPGSNSFKIELEPYGK